MQPAAAANEDGQGEPWAAAILELLSRRAPTASICPSEVARLLGGERWRELMEPVRQAARRLAATGQVQITQGGQVVDPTTTTGPIRIRRGPTW